MHLVWVLCVRKNVSVLAIVPEGHVAGDANDIAHRLSTTR
jgi:hypothetical protein